MYRVCAKLNVTKKKNGERNECLWHVSPRVGRVGFEGAFLFFSGPHEPIVFVVVTNDVSVCALTCFSCCALCDLVQFLPWLGQFYPIVDCTECRDLSHISLLSN